MRNPISRAGDNICRRVSVFESSGRAHTKEVGRKPRSIWNPSFCGNSIQRGAETPHRKLWGDKLSMVNRFPNVSPYRVDRAEGLMGRSTVCANERPARYTPSRNVLPKAEFNRAGRYSIWDAYLYQTIRFFCLAKAGTGSSPNSLRRSRAPDGTRIGN